MTTEATLTAAPPRTEDYLHHARGLWSWLFSLDHKRIGVNYLVGIMVSFLVGGVFALLVRTEHLSPGATITRDPDMYNQWFTLHGAIMVFLFIIPSIPAALGNFLLPILIGAKDVAFPRLNLLSFWCWLAGALLAVLTLATGGVDTGWTFYTPYSIETSTNVVLIAVAAFILGFSSILTGLNFIVTVHKLRAPGMGWFDTPLFVWGLYATAVIQVVATPVLGITLLLLIAERLLGIGIFHPALGGDPILFQHFFWFYSHPAVYIMILPAMGVVSELISTYSHKHIFGYRFIAWSSVAIAVFSFAVWGHHMFTSGQSALLSTLFSALTFSVSIPSAIKVFNWLATMYRGAITLTTGMLYGLAFIFLFSIGGLTGLPLATLASDIHLHDTYFVVAHFHHTMMGGTVIGLLGGLHHWWPKITGRLYSERWGRIAFAFVFVGFNLTFIPQFLLGTHGMPRRYYEYQAQYTTLHQLSTVGSYLQGIGFTIMAVYFLHSLFRGRRAPANPWGGSTLEWRISSPPPPHNFLETPRDPGDPYDYSDLEYRPETDEYVRRERRPAEVPVAG